MRATTGGILKKKPVEQFEEDDGEEELMELDEEELGQRQGDEEEGEEEEEYEEDAGRRRSGNKRTKTTNNSRYRRSSQSQSQSSQSLLHEPQLDDNHWTRDDWAARLLARYFIASIGNRRSVKKDQLLALIASKSSGGAGGRGGGVGQDTALQDMDAAAASTAAAKVPIPQSLRRSFNSIYIRATEIVSDVAGFEILFVDEVPGKANTPHLYILQNKYTYEPYRSANMPLPKDSPLMSILLVVLSLIYVSEKCMSVMDLLEKLEMAFGNLITRGDQVPELVDLINAAPGVSATSADSFNLSSNANRNRGTLESLVTGFIKMGYLEKLKMKGQRLTDTQNKLNAEGLPTTTLSLWDVKWGTRAFVIFSERRARKFIMELYTDLNDSAKQRLLIDIERNSGKLDGKKKEIDINDGKREEEEEDESGDEKEEVEARKVVEEQKRGGPSIQKKGSSSGGGRTSNAAPTRASSRRSQSVVEDDEGSASVRYDRKGKQRA